MLTGLVALAAAAGVGCANMHYNERGLIEQEGSERLYHEVTRTPETLELAVRVMDDGVLKEELVWTRYEPANSAECGKETIHVYVEGTEDYTIIDEECDCEYNDMSGATGADEGTGYASRWGDLNNEEFERGEFTWQREEAISFLFDMMEYNLFSHFNEEEQLADYHRWKGLE